MRIATHEDEFEGGEALGVGRDLGDEREDLGDFAGGQIVQVLTEEVDRAFLVAQHIRD